METQIEELIREFKTIYNGSPWLGNSIKSVLEGIAPEKALETPLREVNCIAGLVSHMITWRMLLIKRMENDDTYDVNQEESFNYSNYGSTSTEIWNHLLNRLDETQNKIVDLLASQQEDFLNKKVARRTYDFRHLTHGVIQHDIYHMGQIAILKK